MIRRRPSSSGRAPLTFVSPVLSLLALQDLMEAVNQYKSRTFVEDLDFVRNQLGGE